MSINPDYTSRWLPFAIILLAVLYALLTGAFGQFETALRVFNEGVDRFPSLDRFSLNSVKFWLSVMVPASLLLALFGTAVSGALGRILIPLAFIVFALWWGVAVFDDIHDDLTHSSRPRGLVSYIAYASHLGLPNLVLAFVASAMIWCRADNETRVIKMMKLALLASIAHAIFSAPLYLASGWRAGLLYVAASLLVLPLLAGILRLQRP